MTSSINFTEAYLDLNSRLIKTMVIKSEASAEGINKFLSLQYGDSAVNQFDENTWKYYLNISGQYHSTDTMMTVTSLDNLEEINFTVANLQIHTATHRAYQYGSRYYYSLLKRYPDQEMLILGVLNPVDINTAIEAPDGTILGYPKDLVEAQERTLIQDLQSYIYRWLARWNVQAFALSDNLYNAAYHAILYLSLLPKLMNLRLARCKTNEVHSFHLREYLASHGRLDRFLPFMTMEQALYLYRNINYIDRNSGKTEQFQELMNKILTNRRIPVSEYSIRQLNEFDVNFYPDVLARRKAINGEVNSAETDYVSVQDLMLKEKALTYGTARYYAKEEVPTLYQLKNSPSSIVQTKDLESSMIDYNDSVPDPLELVLMRQWAYMSRKNLYTVTVNFQDPKTAEFRTVYAQDAFIYMLYIQLMSLGIQVDNVPYYFNEKFTRTPRPTIDDLLTVAPEAEFKDLRAFATELLASQPVIAGVTSTNAFFDSAYAVYEACKDQWYITSSIEDYYKRAVVQNMILRLYADEWVDFNSVPEAMPDWLVSRNLPAYDFTYDQAQQLIRNIFVGSTGLSVDDSRLLKNIQKAMIDMMGQLSSYSVQFIREINESSIRPINWPAVRPGNFFYELEAWVKIEAGVDVIQTFNVNEPYFTLNTAPVVIENYVANTSDTAIPIDVSLTVVNSYEFSRTIVARTALNKMNITYDGYDPEVSDTAVLAGMEYFNQLTDEQKKELTDIYQ
jgi:hypothetical protein